MYMSMDKPIALSSTEGTRGPQVKNSKIKVPRPWELKYVHVHGQTDSAEETVGTRSPQVKKAKMEVPRP